MTMQENSSSVPSFLPALSGGPVETMTSLQMAEVVEKRHDNVKRTIDSLVERGVIQLPQIEEVTNHLGQAVKIYRVRERDSFVVVAQLSPEFTARLVDFWQKHRSAADPAAILNDPAAMRGLLLTYTEKVIALEGEVEEMRPQVQALERIAVADGSLCVTDAAKTLQVRPKDLFSFLRSHGWVYRRPNTDYDIAYQSKLAAGLLEHKTTTVYRSDGSEKVTTQVRVTPKGLTRLAQEFPPVAGTA